jgi:7-carboxy-7-deazaguanine synthase
MIVNEIFSSIEGEGIRAGELCTFVRLAGCNLSCDYCDTKYAQCQQDGKEMHPDEIVAQCSKLGNINITVTGGEPLIHNNIMDLLGLLCAVGFKVNVETNGSMPIAKYKISPAFKDNLFFTMDYKCLSSGMNSHMDCKNFVDLRSGDVLKFVVGNRKDMEQCLAFRPLLCHKYLSPVFGQIEPKEIVEFMKENNLADYRLQIQLHKIVYPPEMRGV